MASLIGAHDWACSALGEADKWPQQLKTLVGVLLGSKQPMFLAWGREQTLIYNDAYSVILANKHPGALGRPFLDVWSEIRADLIPIVEQAYAGQPVHMDDIELLMHRRGYPEEAHFAFSYTPISSDDGDVLGFLCACTEITRQVMAERRREALLTLEERLRDLEDPAELAFAAGSVLGETLGVIRAGYGAIDFETATITVERAWCRPGYGDMSGVHAFDTFGSYGQELRLGAAVAVSDVASDPRTAANAAAFEQYRTRAFLDVPVREAGRVVGQIFLNDGEPRAWTDDEIAFVREVAERTRTAIARRRAEHELRAYNDSLEARVAERTGELETAHEALRQAQKMEAVGQLTGGIAHDFNNLLMGITGSLELLERGLGRQGVRGLERYLQGAQASARRAASLTQRLLAFSRRQTLDPKPTDINKLMYGMEDIIRRTVGPSIEVEVVGQAGLWSARVDGAQLESALLNLAINARDAMPDGGRITIESANKWLDDRGAAERLLTPGQYLSICVSDTGAGIPKEIIDRIFDPFFTTKPIGEGTGLGLSMVHGFVRQSGGQVRVYSEPGQGTTMCLYLPRHIGELEPEDAPEPQAPQSGEGERVLLVDDEPTVRMLMADVLTEAGYAILEAHDAPSALRALQSEGRIDLLVTDVGLPGGMNGRQVADAAREVRPELKVLFVTGFAENAAVGNGLLPAGMQVITKPFQVAAFASKVRDIIDGRS